MSHRNPAVSVSKGLGWFSIALGVAELAAGPQIARSLGLSPRTVNLVRAFGLREIGAGLGVLSAPEKPAWIWARFAGDIIDAVALAPALRPDNPQRTNAIAAGAFVAGAAALDLLTALALGRGGHGHAAARPGRKALLVTMETKPGKADEFEDFLRRGLDAVNDERGTLTWHAIKTGMNHFAVFDTFAGEGGVGAHLAGRVGRGLLANTPTLLAKPPRIQHARVLAYKLPGASGQIAA